MFAAELDSTFSNWLYFYYLECLRNKDKDIATRCTLYAGKPRGQSSHVITHFWPPHVRK